MDKNQLKALVYDLSKELDEKNKQFQTQKEEHIQSCKLLQEEMQKLINQIDSEK
jgi:serine/threonine protein phosphatase PrpC